MQIKFVYILNLTSGQARILRIHIFSTIDSCKVIPYLCCAVFCNSRTDYWNALGFLWNGLISGYSRCKYTVLRVSYILNRTFCCLVRAK